MMRTISGVELIVALLLFGQYIGVFASGYTPGQRFTLFGFFTFLAAGLAAQFKAARLDIPFDYYSWALLAAATLMNIGLGWSLWERRPRKRE